MCLGGGREVMAQKADLDLNSSEIQCEIRLYALAFFSLLTLVMRIGPTFLVDRYCGWRERAFTSG